MCGNVVTLCSLPVVCCLPDACLGCVLVKGQKADDVLLVRTYKITPFVLEPRKSSNPLPPGRKKLSACHALQSARIAPRARPMSPAGLPVLGYFAFCRKTLVRREKLEKVRKIRKHTHTDDHMSADHTSSSSISSNRRSRFPPIAHENATRTHALFLATDAVRVMKQVQDLGSGCQWALKRLVDTWTLP